MTVFMTNTLLLAVNTPYDVKVVVQNVAATFTLPLIEIDAVSLTHR